MGGENWYESDPAEPRESLTVTRVQRGLKMQLCGHLHLRTSPLAAIWLIKRRRQKRPGRQGPVGVTPWRELVAA